MPHGGSRSGGLYFGMDPQLIIAVIVAALVAGYFLFARPVKKRRHDARADESERPELTGEEQYKRREFR